MSDETIEVEDPSEILDIFTALVGTAGWKRMVDLCEQQIQVRRNQLELQPCADTGAVYAQEFIKGEIASLRLFMELPQNQIKMAHLTQKHADDPAIEQKDIADLNEGNEEIGA